MSLASAESLPPQVVSGGLSQKAWAVALTILGVVAGIIWALGLSPFPLVAIAGVAGAFGIAQFSNFRVGISGIVVLLLGLYTVLIRFTANTGIGLSLAGLIALLVIVGLGVTALLRHDFPVIPTWRATWISGALIGAALLFAALFLPFRSAQGYGPVWAMQNDAVIQYIKALPQIDAGGLDTSTRPNSSPLTSALIALVASVGRGTVAPNSIFQHDVLAAAGLWSLLIFTSSVIAGLLAWRTFERCDRREFFENRNGTLLRALTIVGVALLPLSWYFLELSLHFGFYNSTITLIILLAAWHLWLELPNNSDLLIATLLSWAAVAMLATWAPVALIPAILAAIVLLRILARLIRRPVVVATTISTFRLHRWLWWLAAALPVPLYALFFSLSDLTREQENLAQDGAIMGISVSHVFWIFLLAGLLIALRAISTRQWYLLTGLAVIYVSAAIILAFLLHQRSAAGQFLWGYYPIKAAWAITCLLIAVAVPAAIAEVLDRHRATNYPALASKLVGIATVVAVAAMAMFNLGPLPPFTVPFQITAWQQVFPLYEVLRSRGVNTHPWRANEIFRLYRHGQATMAVRNLGQAEDNFANFWLLQLLATSGDDPIRQYAMTLDSKQLDHVCDAIRIWDRPVIVQTTDPELEAELRGICDEANFTVEVH